MTWSEIKKAVEQAGVDEGDEITVIQCEMHNGDKTFHKVRLGRFVKLTEECSESARKEAAGCIA